MKALSVVRPGGSLIAAGRKTIEVRRWRPEIEPSEDLLIVENARYLREAGAEDPDGWAVAIARVANVRPFLVGDMLAAGASSFEEGLLAWELTDVRAVRSGIPLLAARGIYEVELPADLG